MLQHTIDPDRRITKEKQLHFLCAGAQNWFWFLITRFDHLKRLCIGRDLPDAGACARFDKTTKDGKDMSAAQHLLAKAVASIVGKKEERAVASLFTPGGTHAMKGEFQGINDFEVVAFPSVRQDGRQSFFRANPTVWTEDAAGDRHHTAAARQHRGGGHRRDIARHHPARGAGCCLAGNTTWATGF
jgi:hypothetical protein